VESTYRKLDKLNKMNCKYFGICGSCIEYKDGYKDESDKKVAKFSELLGTKLEVFYSQPIHFRARAEFRIWHEGDDISYAMGAIDKSKTITIDECPKVDISIYNLMPKLLEAIKKYDLKHKLFGVDFLSVSSGEVLVSLLYHKKLSSEFLALAKTMADELGILLVCRSRGQKEVIKNDYVTEELNIKNEKFYFRYIENSFTQPNRLVNEQMISWSIDKLSGIGGDLLELYCGAGNFTIPLSKSFSKVLATEISKSSIAAAKENMLLNSIENIEFLRLSAEDFVGAIDGLREYNRLRGVNLLSYNVKTIFVDPPRSGLDELTLELVSRYEHILYISCNPYTLQENLQELLKTHTIEDMVAFDQFAYTPHLEIGVKLIKKSSL
jgi:tRNA (uracil-5-)-methyltransferase